MVRTSLIKVGLQTAAAEVIPDAVTVMDPFHVVALSGGTLDVIRNASGSTPFTDAGTLMTHPPRAALYM
jgi:hypothetical protein